LELEKIKEVVDKVLPLIENFYGLSKFQECTPYVEYDTSIYSRLSGEEDDGSMGDESPDAEYCSVNNEIIIYYPQMKSVKQIIQTLVHEYQHYLQSPTWMKRYYNMGYNYNDHPYEIQATNEEKMWKRFNINLT